MMEGRLAEVPMSSDSTANNDIKHASEALYDLLQSQQSKDTGSFTAAYVQAQHPLVKKAIAKVQKLKNEEVSVKDINHLNQRFMAGHLPRKKLHHIHKRGTKLDSCVESDGDSDEDSDDEKDEIQQKPTGVFSKAVWFQTQFLFAVRDKSVKYLHKTGHIWIKDLVPTRHLATLVTILFYTYVLNVEFLSVFVPMLTFFLAFAVLVVETLRCVRGERRYKEFAAWSNLLSSLETALDVVEAEDNYFKNHVSPLISMPPGVILTVMSFAVCPQQSMPKGEIALICLGLCIVCFISYKSSLDRLALGSIAFQVLATFLEEFKRLSPAVLLKSLSFSVSDGIMINFNLSVIFRILFLCLLLTLPFQSKYRSLFAGFIRGLVPCLFVSVWWELFSFFFYYSSSSSLIRAGIETVVLFFSIPSAVIMLGYGLVASLGTLSFFHICIVLTLIVCGFLYAMFYAHSYKLSVFLKFKTFDLPLKIITYVFLGIIGLTVFTMFRPSGLQVNNSPLTWNDFHELCHNNEMIEGNNALSHRLCHHLDGHNIDWLGKVTDIQIMSAENKLEYVANLLPSFLANWMSCTFGEKYPSEEECETSAYNQLLCSMAKHSQRDCHLEVFTKYQFCIMCEMSSKEGETRNIKLLASNRFQDYVFHLRPGDGIEFKGTLNANAETVKLRRMHLTKAPPFQVKLGTGETVYSMVYDSLEMLLRFTLAPFVSIERNDSDD